MSRMSMNNFPFAVRLIGFEKPEEDFFDTCFESEQGKGYGYFRLAEENLQDPDLYVANALNLKALLALENQRPSDVRPAMLVGRPVVALPYPHVERPISSARFFSVLDSLVERRADALSRLEASDIVSVPEKRRHERFDIDLTDPETYEKLRSRVPQEGSVLVVDRNPALRDYLSELLVKQQVPVAWTDNEANAIDLCEHHRVSVVLLNTSTPGIDPYRLCWGIKDKDEPFRIAVVFMVSKPFEFDREQAAVAGVDGFVIKPIASHHLVSLLKKLMRFK
jgi:CheY-like chemotaxis protein